MRLAFQLAIDRCVLLDQSLGRQQVQALHQIQEVAPAYWRMRTFAKLGDALEQPSSLIVKNNLTSHIGRRKWFARQGFEIRLEVKNLVAKEAARGRLVAILRYVDELDGYELLDDLAGALHVAARVGAVDLVDGTKERVPRSEATNAALGVIAKNALGVQLACADHGRIAGLHQSHRLHAGRAQQLKRGVRTQKADFLACIGGDESLLFSRQQLEHRLENSGVSLHDDSFLRSLGAHFFCRVDSGTDRTGENHINARAGDEAGLKKVFQGLPHAAIVRDAAGKYQGRLQADAPKQVGHATGRRQVHACRDVGP